MGGAAHSHARPGETGGSSAERARCRSQKSALRWTSTRTWWRWPSPWHTSRWGSWSTHTGCGPQPGALGERRGFGVPGGAWLRPAPPSPSARQLLLEHQDWVAPDPRDPLHELLEDLGELPTVPDLVGACGAGRGAGRARCPRVSVQSGMCAGRRVTHSPSLCPSGPEMDTDRWERVDRQWRASHRHTRSQLSHVRWAGGMWAVSGLRRFPGERCFGTCGLGGSVSQVDGRELPMGTVSQEPRSGRRSPWPPGTWAQAAGKAPPVTQGDSPSSGARGWGLGVVPRGACRASRRRARAAASSLTPPVRVEPRACLSPSRSPCLRGECRCRWEHGSEQAGSVPDAHQQVRRARDRRW